jgi:hypothetical protein
MLKKWQLGDILPIVPGGKTPCHKNSVRSWHKIFILMDMTSYQPYNKPPNVEKNPQPGTGDAAGESAEILAFQQKPATDARWTRDLLKPNELFSLFTADIIQRDIIFFR